MRFRTLGALHLSVVFWFGLLLLAPLPSFASVCYAQGEASIQGTVSDFSGGAVPGAAIRIKNVETGADRSEGGVWSAPRAVGQFELSAGSKRSLQRRVCREEHIVLQYRSGRNLQRFRSHSQRRATGVEDSHLGILVIKN